MTDNWGPFFKYFYIQRRDRTFRGWRFARGQENRASCGGGDLAADWHFGEDLKMRLFRVQTDPAGNQVLILRRCTCNNYPALEISS